MIQDSGLDTKETAPQGAAVGLIRAVTEGVLGQFDCRPESSRDAEIPYPRFRWGGGATPRPSISLAAPNHVATDVDTRVAPILKKDATAREEMALFGFTLPKLKRKDFGADRGNAAEWSGRRSGGRSAFVGSRTGHPHSHQRETSAA